MSKATAKVVLFSQKTKKGFPLKIRITKDRRSKYIGLKHYLSKSDKVRYWSESKKQIMPSYPKYEELMASFDKELYKAGVVIDEEHTYDNINNVSFSDYLSNYMKVLNANHQYGMHQKITSVKNHLISFRKVYKLNEDILFSDINIDFLNNLQLYFAEEPLNLKPITQRGYFESIRRILNKAIIENKYSPHRHPFLGFEFKSGKAEVNCLDKNQFKLIRGVLLENVVLINTKTKTKSRIVLSNDERKAGLMFLFQYYSYGMRVSDLLSLQWKNIYEVGSRMKYVMQKTKNQMDFAISKEHMDILFEFFPKDIQDDITKRSKQKSGENELVLNSGKVFKSPKINIRYKLIRNHLYYFSIHKTKKTDRIFSLIPANLTNKPLYSKLQSNTTNYNKDLTDFSVKIGLEDELESSLSSHMARHTFAYLSLLSGQSVYYISKALNHKSLKTTEAYLRKFSVGQLDGKFYKEEIGAIDKKEIDDILKAIISSDDYEKKKKIIDFLSL
jgi:integrase